MFAFITVLIILVSIVLILTVLVQNSKGGGLSSSFGSGNQFGGVVQTNKFLEKATWILAGALLFLSVMASITVPTEKDKKNESVIQKQISLEKNFDQIPVVPSKDAVDKQVKQQNAATDKKKDK